MTETTTARLREQVDSAISSYFSNVADSDRSEVDIFARLPRPIVLDANILRGEIRVVAVRGHDTRLVTLAKVGFLRPVAAPHVFKEVKRHAGRWARDMKIDPEIYWGAWDTKLRLLITEMNFDRRLLTPDERARISRLRDPSTGDPDDVPTAMAAMILEAPVLSNDRKVLSAVYGESDDYDARSARVKKYADALHAGGRIHLLAQSGELAAKLVEVLAQLGFAGICRLRSRIGRMPLALSAVALASWALSNARSRAWLAHGSEDLRNVIAGLGQLYEIHQQEEAEFRKLELPLLEDLEVLPPAIRAERMTARNSVLRVPKRR